VKRLLAVVAGLFGLRALLRMRARPALKYDGSPSPAEDLKARLAESRSSEPQPESSEPAQAATEPTVDEKRVDVHNRARGAIDELKS
jgi:hypothetical protein